jgi:GTP cyclohydrolase IA
MKLENNNEKAYKINEKSLNLLDQLSLEDLIYGILHKIGEDPSREGLLRTPIRVAKAYEFLTKGYHDNLEKILNDAVFTERYNQMVVIKDIDFFSLCEHHLLPFYGKCHIAYIPNEKIVGLSKIPRIVEIFARRLQVQERMTQEIAETINNVLKPQGVAVVIEGRHMCMMMRGVEKQNSIATTSAVTGEFHEDSGTRQEFFNLIKNRII